MSIHPHPAESPATAHDAKGYDSTHLTPRDYLNASQSDPAPFDFCPVFGPGDPVAERRGQWGLLRSRLHQGSNARVQKVIQKALSGMPVTISVLGSSGESRRTAEIEHCLNPFVQFPHATVPAMIRYTRNVTLQNSSNGGTAFSPIPPRNSRTELRGRRIPHTTPTVRPTICPIQRIWLSWNSTRLIPSEFLASTWATALIAWLE